MSAKLKIFGVPMSQAVRTVLWVMLYKNLPFELIITAPGSPKENGTRHPSYLENIQMEPYQVSKILKPVTYYQSQ